MSDDLFSKWCRLQSVPSLPAPINVVVAFVRDCGLSADRLAAELEALDQRHAELLYPEPGRSRHVLAAFNDLHPASPPRSLAKADWPAFEALSYPAKQFLLRRFVDCDRAVHARDGQLESLRKAKDERDRLRDALEKARAEIALLKEMIYGPVQEIA